MATYGKKKKGLLSSFPVFHDDKPDRDTKEQRLGEQAPNCCMAIGSHHVQ